MSSLSSWIMSIAGISVLSVLVDLVMPNGQTRKYIKGIFAFIIVFIIISPLPSLINERFSLDDIFQEEIELQDEYFYQINRNKIEALESSIINDLKKEKVNGVTISINANIFTREMEINAVFVDLSKAVINGNLQHININELVKSTIMKYINIDENKIIFDSNE